MSEILESFLVNGGQLTLGKIQGLEILQGWKLIGHQLSQRVLRNLDRLECVIAIKRFGLELSHVVGADVQLHQNLQVAKGILVDFQNVARPQAITKKNSIKHTI